MTQKQKFNPRDALGELIKDLPKTFATMPCHRGVSLAAITWAPMFPNHPQPWFARDEAWGEIERRIDALPAAVFWPFHITRRMAVDVARAIYSFMDLKTGQITPSLETIAARARCHFSTVKRAIKALKIFRIVDWIPRAVRIAGMAWALEQITNSYRFTLSGWQPRKREVVPRPEPGTTGEPESMVARMGGREYARAWLDDEKRAAAHAQADLREQGRPAQDAANARLRAAQEPYDLLHILNQRKRE